MHQNRTCIFIDGGNFYHLVLKRLGIRELSFDFEKFAATLVGDRELVEEGKRFYVGTVRQQKNGHESDSAISNQTKFFTELSKTDWVLKTSKLRTRTETIRIDDRVIQYKELLAAGISFIQYERSREKGIDVKLATDVIVGAVDGKYDIAIIVSSDTDLVPALDWVRKRKGVLIEYVGFSFPKMKNDSIDFDELKPIKKMIYNSDIQRIFGKEDLRKFIK